MYETINVYWFSNNGINLFQIQLSTIVQLQTLWTKDGTPNRFFKSCANVDQYLHPFPIDQCGAQYKPCWRNQVEDVRKKSLLCVSSFLFFKRYFSKYENNTSVKEVTVQSLISTCLLLCWCCKGIHHNIKWQWHSKIYFFF